MNGPDHETRITQVLTSAAVLCRRRQPFQVPGRWCTAGLFRDPGMAAEFGHHRGWWARTGRIMAALEAARHGARVCSLTQRHCGPQAPVTGNGRSNISNDGAGRRATSAMIRTFWRSCSRPAASGTPGAIGRAGHPTYATADGWRYPLSDSAAAVPRSWPRSWNWPGGDAPATRCVSARPTSGPPSAQDSTWIKGGPGHTVHVDRLVAATAAWPIRPWARKASSCRCWLP
jgi:hypothetical protein